MYLKHTAVLSLLVRVCFSWTFTTGVDLAWPPLTNEGYLTIDSKIVGDDGPLFPCSDQVLTGHEPRALFPINGGQLQWNLTNSTGELSDYYFVINVYIGQISADTSEFHNETAYITTEVWQNFTTREECGGESINATAFINEALTKDFSDVDIVGMNATFGLRSVLISSNEFYPYPPDCGYVTFVSEDTPKSEFGGVCIDAVSPSSTVGPTIIIPTSAHSATAPIQNPNTATRTVVTSSPFATSSASSGTISTPIPPLAGATHDQEAHTSTIGIAVGVSVGVSSILLLLGYLLFRRHRKRGGTIALDFWVHGRQEPQIVGEKGRNEHGIESSNNSVHSEPLPAYTKVDDELQRDVEGKKDYQRNENEEIAKQ
ncbi:hypothetical protein EG329_005910 [Mollisiaceae sp. DMI_Dod_QoI]|nr:hypothetical protein EG329_005910 [Helotiales sp. DMI_Dod_QoI]